MRHLFGYPVRMTLQVDHDTLLDVSEALVITRNQSEISVDLDKVIDLISDHENCTRPLDSARTFLLGGS